MKRLPYIGLGLVGLLGISVASAAEPTTDALKPWSTSAMAPVVAEGDRAAPPPRSSSMSRPVMLLLRFYSSVISPADGARCRMYPTCAGYALAAVRKHGPIVGGVLTADRLTHESSANSLWYEIVRPHGIPRFFDPVELNDFWFSRKKSKPERSE